MSLLVLAISFSVLLFFTVVLKKNLLVSALVSLFSTVLILVLAGHARLDNILAASVHGLLVALEIGLLVFGALLFYNYLKEDGFIQQLENALQQFSTNKLVIAILLAFFFGSFVEGVSGFGTPAMIFAPLLLGLGFPAYLAAALPLLADTVPVIFGAVGTPIKVGLADLATGQIPFYAAILMLLPTIVIPIVFKRHLEAEEMLPKNSSVFENYFIAIAAGVSFALPFILFSFLGPDFPSVAASIIGLTIWLLIIKVTRSSAAVISRKTFLRFYKAFKPYLFIALLLVAGKFLLGDIRFTIKWRTFQLEKSISLFQPGIIFIVGLFLLLLTSKSKGTISFTGIVKKTVIRLPFTFVTIACLAILAKLLSVNMETKELFGSGNIPPALFYVMAIASGFIGSFMAGSATVSNLMFGTEWYHTGLHLHLHVPVLWQGLLTIHGAPFTSRQLEAEVIMLILCVATTNLLVDNAFLIFSIIQFSFLS